MFYFVVGTPGDMWSIGVALVYLLTGTDSHYELNARLAMLQNAGYSAQCMALITGLLQADPDLRLTAEQALKSEWFEHLRLNSQNNNTYWLYNPPTESYLNELALPCIIRVVKLYEARQPMELTIYERSTLLQQDLTSKLETRVAVWHQLLLPSADSDYILSPTDVWEVNCDVYAVADTVYQTLREYLKINGMNNTIEAQAGKEERVKQIVLDIVKGLCICHERNLCMR